MVSADPVRQLKRYRFLDTDAFESDLDYLDGHYLLEQGACRARH